MGHYAVSFVVYLMAMLGFIFMALFIYKKFSISGISNKRNSLIKIEDAMNLNARKTLYVIKTGDERFLIVSDVDRTTLISKLDNDEKMDINSETIKMPVFAE